MPFMTYLCSMLNLIVTPELLTRFWSYVQTVDSGCWEWQGSLKSNSTHPYGQFWDGEHVCLAHRWAYAALVSPIPEGLTIDHLCKNPPCVNPAHLEPVTMQVNMLRGDHASAVAVRTGRCKRGHVFEAGNRGLRKNGTSYCRTCMREAWRHKHPGTKPQRRFRVAA